MKHLFISAIAFCMATTMYANDVVIATLEDTGVEFNDENYWNGGKIGTPEEGDWGEDVYHCSWTSGPVTGHLDYNLMEDYDYEWWGGIALSQRTGTELKNMDDQYNNIVGCGANGSQTFGVIYGDLFSIDINVEGGATVKSMYVVNSSYTMQNVLVGDGYSPKFQNEGDHIYLNITATKADGTTAQEVVKLAEYTTELSYISEWTKVDLSSFGDDVVKLTFTFDAHNSGVPLYACIDDIEIEMPAAKTIPFTIKADNGYGTFCSEYPVQFTDNDNVEAYIATGMNEAKTSVQVQKITDGYVPAGVGVIVKAESAGDYTVHITEATDVEDLEGNLMVGCTEDTEAPEGCYILYVADGCFHPCSGGTIPAGKAYLNVSSLNGKILGITIVDVDPTAITEMTAAQEKGVIYTLGGVRVKNAQQKGIYIINGKKVVIK